MQKKKFGKPFTGKVFVASVTNVKSFQKHCLNFRFIRRTSVKRSFALFPFHQKEKG